jgi:molybdopterin molybdotransferase
MAELAEQATILSFEEARHIVEDHAARLHPRGKQLVDLLSSCGEALAEPVFADRDFPPFPRAARDGYALHASDLEKVPATLEVIAEIKAGDSPDEKGVRVVPGQAAAIMTGAPAPAGADAIVMVEFTSRHGQQVEVSQRVSAGDNIVPLGSEGKRGARLLSPGQRLDYAAIAAAAAMGRQHLLTYAKPKIAVLSTGDELVDIDVPPRAAQIRNSNSYSLAAQIQQAGGEAVLLPIAPDEPQRLGELIAEGLEADLLLIAGGVSAGKYDLVENVLARFQAEFFFTGAKIQPGKPIVFGRAREKYFFGLPGNPVSTMVTFELFVRPVIDALRGMKPSKIPFLHAKLKSEIRTKTGLTRFLPAILSGEFENAQVELSRWQGSGDIASTALANCYIVIPPDREQISAGEWVPILTR